MSLSIFHLAALPAHFVTPLAIAEGKSGAGGALSGMLVPIILMIGIFYVVLIRPERKKQKERDGMLKAIKKGDRVMTTSGILAKVVSVREDEIKLEVADGVRIRFSRQAVQTVLEVSEGKDREKEDAETETKTSPA